MVNGVHDETICQNLMDLLERQFSQVSLPKLLALCIVPVLLFSLSYLFAVLRGPYYLGRNLDPEYAYLLNSLDILHLVAPGHTDHPGTPLQLLGALVILAHYGITSLFHSTLSIQDEVLTHPESYLRSINLSLNGLILLLGILNGKKILQLKGNWILVAAIQFTPFLFTTLLVSTARVSPEPLLLVVVLCLSLILIPAFTAQGRITSSKTSLLLGIILGIGIATKVTALSLLLLVLLPRRIKDKALALASSIVSFFIFSMPSWARLPRLAQWLISIFLRDGRYGHGDIGLPNLEALQTSTGDLLSADPGFFVFLGLASGTWLYLLLKHRSSSASTKSSRDHIYVIALLLTILAGQTAIIIKHPPIHYMVPVMALVGPFMLFLFVVLERQWRHNAQSRVLTFGLSAVLGIGLLSSLSNGIGELRTAIAYRASVMEAQQLIETSFQGCEVIGYYRSSSLAYALAFGDNFSRTKFASALARLHSEPVFYHIWSQTFHGFDVEDRISSSDLQARINRGECLLMQGTPFSEYRSYPEYAAPLDLERVDRNSAGESVYRLVAINSPES